MAEIFVSYTSDDKGWADWIGLELEKLGHKARLFDWEVSAGGNVAKWMVDRHEEADHVLCVLSPRYLDKAKRYSEWERLGALLATADSRPNFLLPVFIEACEAPTLLTAFKRCDLYGLNEQEARGRLTNYLKPPGERSKLFPGLSQIQAGKNLNSRSSETSARAKARTRPEEAHFFISRAGVDSAIGLEVCDLLEASGYKCLIEDRDFGNKNYMGVMNSALRSSARVIALLSDAYQRSAHCEHEWTSTIANDPQNREERLVVLRIADCSPKGGLAAIAYLDLVPHLNDKQSFKQKILDHLGLLAPSNPPRDQARHVEQLRELKQLLELGLVRDEVALDLQRMILSDAFNIPVRR